MSGFEVAGIVLGSIPLIISALEHYQGGLQKISIWRNHTRVLDDLAIQLETENSVLKNTCESLLSGIVSTSEIEAMIADPLGDLWEDQTIKTKLYWKLDASVDIFMKNVYQMKVAVDGLRKELDKHTPRDDLPEKKFIRRELKRIAVALRQPEYEESVKKLAEANSRVARLLDSHNRLARSRRGRSQGRLLSVLQSVAKKVYNALRFSLSCSCPNSHGVNLQLMAPSLIPQSDGESLLKRLDVRIALAYDPNDIKGKGTNGDWVWNELSLRMAESASQPSFSKQLPTIPRKPKSVLFANSGTVKGLLNLSGNSSSTATSSITLTQAMSKVDHNTAPVKLVVLADLCKELSKKSQNAQECCGYVVDSTSTFQNRFGVYPIKSCNDYSGWSTVSLYDLLQSGTFGDRRDGPKLPQQLNIAATVASNILQLHGTPWMPKFLTSDNIYFMRRNGVLSYDQVYVAKQLPNTLGLTRQEQNEYNSRAIKNPVVFAVGVLLIELILCETLESLCPLDSPPSSKLPSPLLRSSTVDDILYQVECAATDKYRDAVNSCLKCNFGTDPSLDDELFREEMYNYVVAPLQDSAQMSRGLPGEELI